MRDAATDYFVFEGNSRYTRMAAIAISSALKIPSHRILSGGVIGRFPRKRIFPRITWADYEYGRIVRPDVGDDTNSIRPYEIVNIPSHGLYVKANIKRQSDFLFACH